MADLQIPVVARIDAADAFQNAESPGLAVDLAIETAAPVIVAAELRRLAAELIREREEEADFAMDLARQIDKNRPPKSDQRLRILSTVHGRLDGLHISIETLSARADELDPPGDEPR